MSALTPACELFRASSGILIQMWGFLMVTFLGGRHVICHFYVSLEIALFEKGFIAWCRKTRE